MMMTSNKQSTHFRQGLGILFAVCCLLSCGRNTKTVKIGADITLSGRFAYFGEQLKNGLELAEKEALEQGQEIDIIIEDNQHNATRAVAIFERFVTVNDVSAAVSLYSPMSFAVRDLASRYRVPLITTYTTATALTEGNQWVFRDFPRMEDQVPAMAEFAYETLGLRESVCIGFNTDFGIDGCELYRSAFIDSGGEVVKGDELVEMGTQDVRDVVVRALSDSPDSIFLVLSAQTLAETVKKLREQAFSGTILGAIMFDSPEVWSAAGDAGVGAYFPSVSFSLKKDPEGRRFAEAYRTLFSEEPDYVAVYGYSIGKYILDAAVAANGDRREIRDQLARLDQASIRGRLTTDTNRNISSPLAIYVRRQGYNELVKEIDSHYGELSEANEASQE